MGRKVQSQMENRIDMDNLPVVVYRFYNLRERRVEYVSKGIKKLLGYSPKELMDEKISFNKFVATEDIAALREKFYTSKKKSRYEVMYEVLHKNGKRVYIADMGTLYREGRKVIFEGVLVDVTKTCSKCQEELKKNYEKIIEEVEKKEGEVIKKTRELRNSQYELKALLDASRTQRALLQNERARLETILYNLGEGLLIVNARKEIIFMNNRFRELLGFEDRIPLGYKKFFVSQFWKDLEGLEEGKQVINKEIWIERPKPAVFNATITKVSLKGEKGLETNYIVILRDVTPEKQLEKMKAEFIADITHELRTPLAPIKEALSLMLEGATGNIIEIQKKFLGIALENIRRLLKLINNLLDVTKMERGKMEIHKEKSDLKRLIELCITEYKLIAEKTGLKLVKEVEEVGKVLLDKDRIMQVLGNLVSNAIKFSPKGGIIRIGCRVYPKDERYVEVYVADQGCGIPKDQLKEIFDRYKQVRVEDVKKGTGLGLTISKYIIELHNGKIWAESEEGKGATLRFILPKEDKSTA